MAIYTVLNEYYEVTVKRSAKEVADQFFGPSAKNFPDQMITRADQGGLLLKSASAMMKALYEGAEVYVYPDASSSWSHKIESHA